MNEILNTSPNWNTNYCDRICDGYYWAYNNIAPYKTIISDTSTALWYFYRSNPQLFDRMLELARSSTSRSDVWGSRVIQALHIIPIVSTPFAFYSIGQESYRVIKQKNVIESALKTTEGLAWLGDSVSATLIGVNKLPYFELSTSISSSLAEAAFGVSIASTVLWLSSIVLHTRGWHKSSSAISEMEKTLQIACPSELIQAQIKVIDNIQKLDRRAIRTTFNLNGKSLQASLDLINSFIQDQVALDNPAKANEVATKITSSLKNRASDKIGSHKLGILSGIITAIGTAVLLFTAITFLSYSLLFVGVVLSIGRALYEKRSVERCEKTLNEYTGVNNVAHNLAMAQFGQPLIPNRSDS